MFGKKKEKEKEKVIRVCLKGEEVYRGDNDGFAFEGRNHSEQKR